MKHEADLDDILIFTDVTRMREGEAPASGTGLQAFVIALTRYIV